MPSIHPPLDFSFPSERTPADKPLIVFVHGWPDSAALWTELTHNLADDYLCICIKLPGFGIENAGKAPSPSFTDLVASLDRTISQVLATYKQERIILVGHDWGAYLSYLYEIRASSKVAALITLDVGPTVRLISIGHATFIISYQWWLIAAWWIGFGSPKLGNWMSQKFAALAGAPFSKQATARMGYLYYRFWQALLQRKSSELLPRDYFPRVPTLFLFGARKRYHFHSGEWVAHLQFRRNCEAHAIEGAGHWILTDHFSGCLIRIRTWLEKTEID